MCSTIYIYTRHVHYIDISVKMCFKQMRWSFKYSQHVASLPQPIVRGPYDLSNNDAGQIENVRGPCGARTMLY